MDELKPGHVRITSNEGRAVEIETIPCQHQCDHGRDHKVGDGPIGDDGAIPTLG